MPLVLRTQTGWAATAAMRRYSLLLLLHSIAVNAFLPFNYTFPTEVTYHASVMTNVMEQAKPLAYYDENYVAEDEEPFQQFRGFQPDLLRALIKIAKDLDNITVTFELEEALLFSYDQQFNFMANDCNHTVYKGNAIPKEDCNRLDLIVGDFYTFPWRSIRAPFSPTLLNAAGGALQYVHRKNRQIATLEQAQALQEPVCLLDNSHYNKIVMKKYPETNELQCFSHEDCVAHLKAEECALFVDDDLQLKYMVVQDIDLRMAPESIAKQDIAWPFHHDMATEKMQLLIRWILEAKRLEILEALYEQYFSVTYCPIGKAGKDCTLPCSPTNGLANREGACICDSNRWTGPDCETEVLEELNLIPPALKATSYAMIAINFSAVAIAALWLYRHRATFFLKLILLGCLISTSTIFALTQEDEGDGPVHSCMVRWKHNGTVAWRNTSYCIPYLTAFFDCHTPGYSVAVQRRVRSRLRMRMSIATISIGV
jgi:Bacterial extracellular solute-binding proteins, family 3